MSEQLPSNLLPCPHCNRVDALSILPIRGGFDVVCDHVHGGCGASCGICATKEAAIARWNGRHPPQVASRDEIQRWRDDAFEAAAKIADRYGATHAAADMRALIRTPITTPAIVAVDHEGNPVHALPAETTAALQAYAQAMQAAGVPHEPLQVYDSNSWRRVGLASRYHAVMSPYVANDGHPDIDGANVLRALVAAFNCMLERQSATGPLKLDTDGQVFFYEQDHYYLSNFSAFRVRLLVDDGSGGEIHASFDTSEAAYHWFKFPGKPEMQARIRAAQSAHDAFKLAEQWKQFRRPDWDDIKVDTMRDILRAKVQQHEYVHRKLLDTGDRELIENSWRDDVWGWGPNRDGQNMLGRLWMEIRAELRAATGPTATDFGGGSAE